MHIIINWAAFYVMQAIKFCNDCNNIDADNKQYNNLHEIKHEFEKNIC